MFQFGGCFFIFVFSFECAFLNIHHSRFTEGADGHGTFDII